MVPRLAQSFESKVEYKRIKAFSSCSLGISSDIGHVYMVDKLIVQVKYSQSHLQGV